MTTTPDPRPFPTPTRREPRGDRPVHAEDSPGWLPPRSGPLSAAAARERARQRLVDWWAHRDGYR